MYDEKVRKRAVEYGSSGQSAIISGFQLSAIVGKSFPAKAAAPLNPHRRPTTHAFPRVPSSEAFGRRPAILAQSIAPGRHPKPFTKADNDRELGSTTDELAMNVIVQSSKDR